MVSLNKDHSGILKQLATLKQQQFLQQKQQQLNTRRHTLNNDNATDVSNGSARFNLSQGSITNGTNGTNHVTDASRNNLNQQSQSLSVNSNISLSLSSQSVNSRNGMNSKGSNNNNNDNNNNDNNNNNNNNNNNSSTDSNINKIANINSNNNNVYDNNSAAAIVNTAINIPLQHEAASVHTDRAVNLLATAAAAASSVAAFDLNGKKQDASAGKVLEQMTVANTAAKGVLTAASNTSNTTAAASSSAPVLKAICSEVMDTDMKTTSTSSTGSVLANAIIVPIAVPVATSDVGDKGIVPMINSDVLTDLRDDVTYMSTLLPLYQDLLKSTTLLLAHYTDSDFNISCTDGSKARASQCNEKEKEKEKNSSWKEHGKQEFKVSNDKWNKLQSVRAESRVDTDLKLNGYNTLTNSIKTVQNTFNSFMQNKPNSFMGLDSSPLGPLGGSTSSGQQVMGKGRGKSSWNLIMASAICGLARCLLSLSLKRSCHSDNCSDDKKGSSYDDEEVKLRSGRMGAYDIHLYNMRRISHEYDRVKERNMGTMNVAAVADNGRESHPEQESLLTSLNLLNLIIEHLRTHDIAIAKKARKVYLSYLVSVTCQDNKEGLALMHSSSSSITQNQDRKRNRNNEIQAAIDLNSKFENVAETNHKESTLQSTYVSNDSAGKKLQKTKSINKLNGLESKDNLNSPGTALMNTIMKERNVAIAVAGHRGLSVTRGLTGSGKKNSVSVSFADRGHATPVAGTGAGTHTHTGYGEDGNGNVRRGSIDGDSAPPSASTTHDVGGSVPCKRPRLMGPKHIVPVSAGIPYFPLSSITMPGMSSDMLKSFYDEAASVHRIEDTTHASSERDPRAYPPLRELKLSGLCDTIARLPGDLVDLIGDLCTQFNNLTIPLSSSSSSSSSSLSYTTHDLQYHKNIPLRNRSSFDISTYRLSLLDGVISLLSKIFKGRCDY